jgi:MYXO-CTERM domain-containing protein
MTVAVVCNQSECSDESAEILARQNEIAITTAEAYASECGCQVRWTTSTDSGIVGGNAESSEGGSSPWWIIAVVIAALLLLLLAAYLLWRCLKQNREKSPSVFIESRKLSINKNLVSVASDIEQGTQDIEQGTQVCLEEEKAHSLVRQHQEHLAKKQWSGAKGVFDQLAMSDHDVAKDYVRRGPKSQNSARRSALSSFASSL